jgi:TetR/AcrR family transcriptional regulator, regulator of biofilm formation and stress response
MRMLPVSCQLIVVLMYLMARTSPPKHRARRTVRAAPPRARLLAATIVVIARDGVRAATHRAIATEAGVSLSATTYYFSSRDDLVHAAFEDLATREISALEDGRRRLPAKMSGDLAAALLAAAVAEELVDRRDQVRAELELHIEAGRDDRLRETHRRWVDASVAFFAAALAAAGSRQPELDGILVLAAVSGIQLGELADPAAHPERDILGPLLRRLIFALLGP